MNFGLAMVFMGSCGEPPMLRRLAALVDEAGMPSIWAPDHTVFPPDAPAGYPYTKSGSFDPAQGLACHDSITTLAWVSELAPRARVGISVLVVPNRNPVLMTKALATVDVLSGGRAMLGAGAGWLAEEFEALGADFARRGAVTDEYLQIYQALCRDDRPSFAGEHYRLPEVVFSPKPVQRPWPPIYVGGNSAPALRRAARYGDFWQPVSQDEQGVAGAREKLDRACEQIGRDPGDVGLSMRCYFHVNGTEYDGAVADALSPGQLVGSVAELAERVNGLAEAGVEEVVFAPLVRHEPELYFDQMQKFGREVAAAVN
jgi:probable F420-dependent oxidoreductase